MARLLVISNGHGEDLSGALLGEALKLQGHEVEALPMVGLGSSYIESGIKIIGKTKEYSTGGLGYTSLKGRLTELFQGQLFYLLSRLYKLLISSYRYQLILVVGDIVPIFAAWLTSQPVAIYLVAYSSHYEGRLKMPWPCRPLLKSRRFVSIYSRDELTAEDLSIQLDRKVVFLGNPFMEIVFSSKRTLPGNFKYRLGLLPGSRRPELDHNLELMLKTISFIPKNFFLAEEISIDMALVSALTDNELEKIALKSGWRIEKSEAMHEVQHMIRGQSRINIYRKSFVQVLQSSDILFSMTGTAAEQAVGLAKPVLQIPGKGPQFTSSFAEAQRRLLGPTVFCAEELLEGELLLQRTALMLIELLRRSKEDVHLQAQCKKEASLRLGPNYGGQLIAGDISNCLLDLLSKK